MEYGLRVSTEGMIAGLLLVVLILVLMEYGLRDAEGSHSDWVRVLILVLMEYGLRGSNVPVGSTPETVS